jgi:glycosyltransferase involved in cell wall biosynthesis
MTMGIVDRGAERVVDLLATGLSQNNEVLVIQAGRVDSSKKYLCKRVYNLESAPLVAPRNFWEKIMFRMYLDKSSRQVVGFTLEATLEISKFDPDLIIVMNGAEQLKIIKHNFPNIKTVVFGEAGIGYHDKNTILAKPDLFVALTESASNWANKYRKGNTQIIVVPNPVELKKSKAIDLHMLSPIVMVAGALTSYKNIRDVIEAAKSNGYSLLLIGDGEESEIVAKSLSNFPSDFRWVKHVDPDDMMSYYLASDVFCFVPDQQEAFGNVYIEAMAAGLPIVASDDPIRREIVGNKGIYVEPHNIESIKLGMQKAAKLGKQKYETELTRFSLPVISKQLGAIFHDLIN